MNQQPLVSVIIPAYNRQERLKLTLNNVSEAINDLDAEVIIVDDGSEPALVIRELIASDLNPRWFRLARQPNQGSIIARQHGLRLAQGEFVQFVDSDDFIEADKIKCQLEIMDKENLDVSYTDCRIDTEDGQQRYASMVDTNDGYELCLWAQPAPHAPIYRKSLIADALLNPHIAPLRCFDPAGDTWIFFNISLADNFRTCKIPQALAICNYHEAERFSTNWERIGLAALGLMWFWADWVGRHQPEHPGQIYVGKKAFHTWLCLPNGLKPWHLNVMLEIWRMCGSVPYWDDRLRRLIVTIFGVRPVGGLMRRLRRPDYNEICTISEQEYNELIVELQQVMQAQQDR